MTSTPIRLHLYQAPFHWGWDYWHRLAHVVNASPSPVHITVSSRLTDEVFASFTLSPAATGPDGGAQAFEVDSHVWDPYFRRNQPSPSSTWL